MKQLLLLVCSFAVVWSGTLIAQTQSPLPSSSQPQSSSPAPSGAQAQAPGSQSLHATSWSGTLADATCKEKTPSDKCAVTSTTTAFGVATADGSFYKLDSNGNAKVAQEIQKDGTKVATANVQVKGSLQGDMIQVDSVLMQ